MLFLQLLHLKVKGDLIHILLHGHVDHSQYRTGLLFTIMISIGYLFGQTVLVMVIVKKGEYLMAIIL